MWAAVLFDLDETLLQDEPVSDEAFRLCDLRASQVLGRPVAGLGAAVRAALQRLAPQQPEWPWAVSLGHGATEWLWASYEGDVWPEAQALAARIGALRAQVWTEGLGAATGAAAPELGAELSRLWPRLRRHYPLYPEAEEVLLTLRPQTKLGLVTNGVSSLQREKLRGSGLGAWFDAVAVSGEVGCGKPDARLFDWVCARLGVPPAACLMVGDNPERDIAGAQAAGMPSVWVRRHGRQPDPRFVADRTQDDLRGL
jgi:putative hydrolase of the HAD superfamily